MTSKKSKKSAEGTPASGSEAKREISPLAEDDVARPSQGRTADDLIQEMEEDLRRFEEETDERILELWRKRGLFGFTTSTG